MQCMQPWRKIKCLIVSCCLAVLVLCTACSSGAHEPPKIESKPYIQHSESAQPEQAAALPPYDEIGSVQHQTLFEFDCTALTNTWTQSGTHTVFECTYGETDEQAMMDMDYRKNRDDLVKGAKLHVRCRLKETGADGTPWFEVLSYTVES